jgi:hypothetical protein
MIGRAEKKATKQSHREICNMRSDDDLSQNQPDHAGETNSLAASPSTRLDRAWRMRASHETSVGGGIHNPRPAPVCRRGLTGAKGSSRIRSAQSNHVDECQISASESVVPALASALAIAVGPSLLTHDVFGMQSRERFPGYGIPSSLIAYRLSRNPDRGTNQGTGREIRCG